MKLFLIYFQLEWKRGLKSLPRLLAGALILCFLLSSMAICAKELLYKGNLEGKVKIALSIPEKDEGIQWMFSMLNGMESIKNNCEFIEATEEEALKMLRREEVSGVILIPERFLDGILDGTNLPAKIILSQGSALEKLLIEELTSAGAVTLGAAQAGIYAVTEFYAANHTKYLIPKLEKELNFAYLDYALPRETLFRHEKVSATGVMTTTEYYIASGCVFFMLLWGIACSGFFRPQKGLHAKLRVFGLGPSKIILIQMISLWGILFITMVLLGGIGMIAASIMGISFSLHWNNILFFAAALWLAAGMITFIYSIASGIISGALLLFIVSSGMMFLSGGFLPIVFLPKLVQELAPLLPVYHMIQLTGSLFMEEVSQSTVFSILLFTGFFFAGSAAVMMRRIEGKGEKEE